MSGIALLFLVVVAVSILGVLHFSSVQVWQGTDAKSEGGVEKLYKQQPWMAEGTYCVGTRPKSLGEGVVVVAYSVDYDMAWKYWDDNADKVLAIYRWSSGALVKVGVKKTNARGMTYWVPVPPDRLASA